VPVVPALSFQLFTFLVALNHAYFLRKALRWEAHWVRAFTTLAVLTLGGASLVAVLKGEAVPALKGDALGNGQLMAVALAYLITFCVPGGRGTLLVGTPAVRPVWQTVAALNVAFNVRAALAHAPASASGLLLVLLAVVQATGGALIAEYSNMLLLQPDAYKNPQGGPGPNTILAVAAAVVTMLFKLEAMPVKVPAAAVETCVALALVAVSVLTTPDKVQELCNKALRWLPNGSVVEPEEDGLEDEEDLPWPLSDGLWGYELSAGDYQGDDGWGSNFFWAGDEDDEDDEGDEGEEGAGAAKAKSPAAAKAKSPAAKAASPAAVAAPAAAAKGKKAAKAAKAASPAPAAPTSRRRAGSTAGK